MSRFFDAAFTVSKYFPIDDERSPDEVGQSTFFLYGDRFVRYEYYDARVPAGVTNAVKDAGGLVPLLRVGHGSKLDMTKSVDASYAAGGDAGSVWLIQGEHAWQTSLELGTTISSGPVALSDHFNELKAPFTEKIDAVLPFAVGEQEQLWLFSGKYCCLYADDEAQEPVQKDTMWPDFDFAVPTLDADGKLTATGNLFKGATSETLQCATMTDLSTPSPGVNWETPAATALQWPGLSPAHGSFTQSKTLTSALPYGQTDTQKFTVPDGVTSLNLELWGPGGSAGHDQERFAGQVLGGGPGGAGAYLQKYVFVSPGSELSFQIGPATRINTSAVHLIAAGGGHGGGGAVELIPPGGGSQTATGMNSGYPLGGGPGGSGPGYTDTDNEHLIGAANPAGNGWTSEADGIKGASSGFGTGGQSRDSDGGLGAGAAAGAGTGGPSSEPLGSGDNPLKQIYQGAGGGGAHRGSRPSPSPSLDPNGGNGGGLNGGDGGPGYFAVSGGGGGGGGGAGWGNGPDGDGWGYGPGGAGGYYIHHDDQTVFDWKYVASSGGAQGWSYRDEPEKVTFDGGTGQKAGGNPPNDAGLGGTENGQNGNPGAVRITCTQ